ncbi:hypothetical protein E2C01_053698 [Portunus trituberculatus]|uniref:Uncharacterized protein n=1 Tax=Portunus trituberculatus TaxID=210409 RepID=A0A5B7GSZ2_PORTR|nr:hypothetical protein [Portunus trituberculatus]
MWILSVAEILTTRLACLRRVYALGSGLPERHDKSVIMPHREGPWRGEVVAGGLHEHPGATRTAGTSSKKPQEDDNNDLMPRTPAGGGRTVAARQRM